MQYFQNEAHECKYGILNLRAYYNQNTQTLVVEGTEEIRNHEDQLCYSSSRSQASDPSGHEWSLWSIRYRRIGPEIPLS